MNGIQYGSTSKLEMQIHHAGAVPKFPFSVIPAKVGIHNGLFLRDARFRRPDDLGAMLLFLDVPLLPYLRLPQPFVCRWNFQDLGLISGATRARAVEANNGLRAFALSE